MGNALWRLETALNYVGERAQALGREAAVEVLVADWGSDVPLRDVVRLGPAAARLVSFVTVPPALARDLQRDSPFPEVLALNAAARRARGQFIGRIDQDTLVGERFLRWFFDTTEGSRPGGAIGPAPDSALFFANRRDIPYRFAAASPSLAAVTRFLRLCGARLPVWSENDATGHVFWTSNVGIWLAHRDLWDECGGYDERLIYYNWMETDMICRLRQRHAVVDLGALTGYDFYHLEHVHPRAAGRVPRHAMKNAAVDLAAPAQPLHPNTDAWGLHNYPLTTEPGTHAATSDATTLLDHGEGTTAFALAMLRLAAGAASDRVVAGWTFQGRQMLKLARVLGVSDAVLATGAGYRWHLKRHFGVGRPLGRPDAPWRNAVLKNRREWEAATAQVAALGLPPHPTPSKNWDSLAAVACILQHTPASARILDAGAAVYSVVLPWLFLYGYRNLVGINADFNRTARRGPIRYERGDITRSRFGANTFDAVVCQSVLEHGVDVSAYLQEMARILRPGGLLITSVDYYADPVDVRGQMPDGRPYRVFTRAEVSRMLSDAEALGLKLTDPLDLACEERAVEWTAFGLAYTLLIFTLRKNPS